MLSKYLAIKGSLAVGTIVEDSLVEVLPLDKRPKLEGILELERHL